MSERETLWSMVTGTWPRFLGWSIFASFWIGAAVYAFAGKSVEPLNLLGDWFAGMLALPVLVAAFLAWRATKEQVRAAERESLEARRERWRPRFSRGALRLPVVGGQPQRWLNGDALIFRITISGPDAAWIEADSSLGVRLMQPMLDEVRWNLPRTDPSLYTERIALRTESDGKSFFDVESRPKEFVGGSAWLEAYVETSLLERFAVRWEFDCFGAIVLGPIAIPVPSRPRDAIAETLVPKGRQKWPED